jgi:hypothetical protein
LPVLGGLYSGVASAQQTALLADQNPRYRESQAKYARGADSLTSLQGTTIQDTYKAYDWYEAKLERRRQNREWRHQERMNGYLIMRHHGAFTITIIRHQLTSVLATAGGMGTGEAGLASELVLAGNNNNRGI